MGTSKHIICDDEGFILSDSIPRDSWHLTGKIKSGRCLDTLLKLINYQTVEVPEKYRIALEQLNVNSRDNYIPWRYVLPAEDFKLFFKNTINGITEIFSDLPFDYHKNAWLAGTRVLSSLKPAKINIAKLNNHISESIHSAPVLESFKPKKNGFSQRVVYDRFSTRTGRLTVSEGPNILVLKKNFRDIIESSWEKGKVFYLDFRALEARIVLAESGRYSDAQDLYNEIAINQFQGSIPRDTVKTAILAELYGISRSALKLRLGITDSKLSEFINVLEDYFNIKMLKQNLHNQCKESRIIKNRFGRPLRVPVGQDNLLINTYAQSSGVDVSMIGFDTILQKLGPEGIRPLFVLHDAIIIDVHPDRINDIKSFSEITVNSYEKKFPFKLEDLI